MRDLCHEEVEKIRHSQLWTEVVISGGTSTTHILSTLEIPKSLADHTRALQFGGFVIENAERILWLFNNY
ncbi:hypothetical protein MRB53_010564 [Persea americana]|uniref:Uncharacterized protein n=1 Tax=Persea americana TaxID=3435 RepID=A0ACC2LS88_PERAE|nr:hypothetical protein MRB53_010564 [Persea americana]